MFIEFQKFFMYKRTCINVYNEFSL